jgi:carboxymethylenebutenolidase
MCFDPDSTPPIDDQPHSEVDCALLTLTADDGNELQAYAARPRTGSPTGVVVMPDVRGLYLFYRQLAERFAQACHAAVAIDYFGRTAGTGERDDDFLFMEHVAKTTRDGVQSDVDAAVAYLRSPAGGGCEAVFTVGFCFGGRRSWVASAIGRDLAGVIGFYGRPGDGPDGPGPTELATSMSVPVLALMGGADEGIPAADVAAFEQALAAAGVPHEVITYPGAPHSFFDRKFVEYADASADAWQRVLSFIDRYRSP